jgi:uncharacterized protein (UPF0332 family)
VIDKLLKKARQSLKTARLDLEAGDTDASVNRSYYAAFYAAWAMFEAAGVDKPKKHSGMISEFGRRFVKEGPLDPSLGATLARLENLRNFADYEPGVSSLPYSMEPLTYPPWHDLLPR